MTEGRGALETREMGEGDKMVESLSEGMGKGEEREC